jgi:hypothetical protein
MLDPGRGDDRVPGPKRPDLATALLIAALAGDHLEDLAALVAVPVGDRSVREADPVDTHG